MSPSKKISNPSNESIKGSPTPGEPLYIPFGRFGRPFSYKGAMIFFPHEDYHHPKGWNNDLPGSGEIGEKDCFK